MLLEARGLTKTYSGVTALRGVSLSVSAGEVVAVVGENGAGKSTLVRLLGGAMRPNAGSLHLNGREVHLSSPAAAHREGVAVIHQELNLIPDLSARENIFLGRESTSWGWLRRGAERNEASVHLARLGFHFAPDTPCRRLSIAEQQGTEIARALVAKSRLLIMDEPTAALTPLEAERLLAVVHDLRQSGMGVIYISHRLDEVLRLADRIVVLRDGELVGEWPTAQVTRSQLIEHMVGRRIDQEFPPRRGTIGPPRLEVRGLSRGTRVRDVSFDLRAGEIVALAGLVGSGRTEVVRLLFGADRVEHGKILLDGRELRIRRPSDAIRAGICLLTEDRKGQGLLLNRSLVENFALPNLRQWSRGGWIRARREARAFVDWAQRLRIRMAHAGQPARTLSGGNQQKLLLARWLQSRPEIILFDEPTRGVDVGAKFEIYEFVRELAGAGKCVLLVTSELPEALGLADRILVMHAGRITGQITEVSEATQQQILDLAVR